MVSNWWRRLGRWWGLAGGYKSLWGESFERGKVHNFIALPVLPLCFVFLFKGVSFYLPLSLAVILSHLQHDDTYTTGTINSNKILLLSVVLIKQRNNKYNIMQFFTCSSFDYPENEFGYWFSYWNMLLENLTTVCDWDPYILWSNSNNFINNFTFLNKAFLVDFPPLTPPQSLPLTVPGKHYCPGNLNDSKLTIVQITNQLLFLWLNHFGSEWSSILAS